MKASIANQIAPNTQRINSEASKLKGIAQTNKVGADPIDFREVLLESQAKVKEGREKAKAGDLSSASNYQEFLDALHDQTKPENTRSSDLGKDDFLKLFVTQLQQQDPLNPKDGAEMASQLAQFNSVEQMMNMTKAIERLESAQKAGQSGALLNYIGKTATVDSNQVQIKAGDVEGVSFELRKAFDTVNVKLMNAEGKTIYTDQLSGLPKGTHNLKLSGKDAKSILQDGVYTLELTGIDSAEQEVNIPTRTQTAISGIKLESEGHRLISNMGEIAPEKILEISEKAPKQKKGVEKPSQKSVMQPDSPPLAGTSNTQVSADPIQQHQPLNPTSQPSPQQNVQPAPARS